MKRKILLFVLLTSGLNISSMAQTGVIPNGNLNTWTNVFFTYDEPNSWASSNQYKALDTSNPVTVYKTTDSHAGTYAARIETKAMSTAPAPDFDTLGFLLCGSLDFSTGAIKGFPYSSRPERLEYFYKYLPMTGDEGGVYVSLTKWDSNTGSSILIADGGASYTQSVNSYTQGRDTLTYYTNDVPDTASIIFVSSNFLFGSPKVGSVLFIDEVTFQGQAPVVASLGDKDTERKQAVAYPNPASTEVNFEVDEKATRIVATHFGGSTQATIQLVEGKGKLETSTLAAGIYFYQVFNEDKKLPFAGKFVVVK